MLAIFTLTNKYNIHALSVDIQFICTHRETGKKRSPNTCFSTFCKTRTNDFYILKTIVHILYLDLSLMAMGALCNLRAHYQIKYDYWCSRHCQQILSNITTSTLIGEGNSQLIMN